MATQTRVWVVPAGFTADFAPSAFPIRHPVLINHNQLISGIIKFISSESDGIRAVVSGLALDHTDTEVGYRWPLEVDRGPALISLEAAPDMRHVILDRHQVEECASII